MPVLDEYLKLGIDSLKVEGRGKSPYYVAIVARAYRMAIDDYYADPENWNPDSYIKELMHVPNRGYTLAFHEGRLEHHSHNFESTAGLADWEYAGIISKVRADAFIVEPKNKIAEGDVLELLSPIARETILLRIYEFENINNGKITTEIHAGQKPLIRIPFAWFDHEELEMMQNKFPIGSIIRKERPLSEAQWERIKLDKEAAKIELGKQDKSQYWGKVEKLQNAIDAALPDQHFKTPRLGKDGCCGRGCNGCMIFWHDDKYAPARAIMQAKKQGEMIEQAEAKTLASGG